MCLLNFALFFQINYQCKFGESVYVVGNIDLLGNWNSQKALKLNWSEGHMWSAKIKIVHDNKEPIQYKYIIAPTDSFLPSQAMWEKGPNHFVNLYSTSKLFINLNDEWEHFKVKIAVHNEALKKNFTSNQRMYICTSLSPRSPPIEMKLKKHAVEDGLREDYFWTASLKAPYHVTSFGYKLKIANPETREVQTDRVHRKFDLKKFPFYDGSNEVYKVECATRTKFDFRFGTAFNFDTITEDIFVGSFPSKSIDIEELLASEVKAVLNLQTPSDMEKHGIEWEQLENLYAANNIAVEHYPINDMDITDLSLKIHQASALIEKLIKAHGKVYVHCTAGKYRSVHAVIYYLWQCGKFSLEDACELIRNKRAKAKVSIYKEVFGKRNDEVKVRMDASAL